MVLFTVHSQLHHISTTNTASPQQQTDTEEWMEHAYTHTHTQWKYIEVAKENKVTHKKSVNQLIQTEEQFYT